MRPMKPREPGSPKDALVRLLEEIAASQGRDRTAGPELAAAFLDVSLSYIHKSTDPDQREDLGFRRVSQLTRHFGVAAAAEHLAACAGGLFFPLPTPSRPSKWSDLTAGAASQMGDVVAAIIRAHADEGAGGARLTRAERAEVLVEIDDVLRTLAHLRNLLLMPPG